MPATLKPQILTDRRPNALRVLIACEYSGAVRDAFIALGHEAMSCDVLPTSTPGPHHIGDVLPLLDQTWDLVIAHPPCTYLSSSGLHWNKRDPSRAAKTDDAAAFFMRFTELDCPWAVENPVGCMSTRYRKPDQYIHPHGFGHPESKTTGLWLNGLPLLEETGPMVSPRWVCCGEELDLDTVGLYGCVHCEGDNEPRPRGTNQTNSGQNNLTPSEDRGLLRAKFYTGWAKAMAEQWGAYLTGEDVRAVA